MPHEVSASRTTNPLPVQRGDDERAPGDPEPEHPQDERLEGVRPVPLDRLLSIAVLTPAQASLLAMQLLDAARVDGLVNGSHGAIHSVGAVSLTSAGALDVSRPNASTSTPVNELVRGLVHNARRLPAHPRPEQVALLRKLERVADDELPDPDARARDLEAAMAETLGHGALQRLSGQLAALVDAFSHVAASVPARVDALPTPRTATSTTLPAATSRGGTGVPRPSARVAHRAAPPRHGAGRPPRRSSALRPRRRSRRVLILCLALAVLVVIGAYVLLSNRGGDTIASPGRGQHAGGQRKHHGAQESKTGAKRPSRHRQPVVPALAGRHAGPVTGVALQRTGSCRPAAPCPVRVTVRFRPPSTTQPVTWRVGTVHACKRGVTWSAPVTVMAQPGWTTVYASSSVLVPKGRALVLTALTTTPARAQSPPVPVDGSALHC